MTVETNTHNNNIDSNREENNQIYLGFTITHENEKSDVDRFLKELEKTEWIHSDINDFFEQFNNGIIIPKSLINSDPVTIEKKLEEYYNIHSMWRDYEHFENILNNNPWYPLYYFERYGYWQAYMREYFDILYRVVLNNIKNADDKKEEITNLYRILFKYEKIHTNKNICIANKEQHKFYVNTILELYKQEGMKIDVKPFLRWLPYN